MGRQCAMHSSHAGASLGEPTARVERHGELSNGLADFISRPHDLRCQARRRHVLRGSDVAWLQNELRKLAWVELLRCFWLQQK